MGDVQVKCTCTYLQEWSSGCQARTEIEVYFERRPEYPETDPHGWRIFTAPVSLCQGRHEVSWIPMGTPVDFTEFEPVSTKPAKVNLDNWPPKPDPKTGKWTVVIENTGVVETNGFSYRFKFNPRRHSGKPLSSRDIMHDPTIAVTPDPLEPPRHSY